MIKVVVNYEKDGKQAMEEYDISTERQIELIFRDKHIRDKAQMKSYDIKYEFEYVVKTANGDLYTGVRDKNRIRTANRFKRSSPFTPKFTVIPIPQDKETLEKFYKVGDIFELEYSKNGLPEYLKKLGVWKSIGNGKFKRIS